MASGENVDIRNAEASTVLNVDGVNLKNGDRVLLWKQIDASENGVYVVAGLDASSPTWSLLRSADAADYNTLTPGSFISITGGVTYIGVQFFYDTHNLNYATWPGGAKTFTVGNLLAAEQSLIAITTLNSTRFDAPIGDTPTFKPSLPSTVYFLKSLTIN